MNPTNTLGSGGSSPLWPLGWPQMVLLQKAGSQPLARPKPLPADEELNHPSGFLSER